MASAQNPGEVVRRVVRALETAQVPYMLTGTLASALHGTPRSTQDIDLVILPTRESLELLLGAFPTNDYYLSREAAFKAFDNNGSFKVVDFKTGWKIDFIVRRERHFSQQEFERRASTKVLGLNVYVASAEDVLISKLEWPTKGESERQLRDAAGIIRTQGSNLDVAYVSKWVKELGLESRWDAAKATAV